LKILIYMVFLLTYVLIASRRLSLLPIGSLSKFSFIEFFLYAGPAAAVGIFLNIGLLWLYYGRGLPKKMSLDFPVVLPGNRNHLWIVLMVTGGVIIGFFAGFHLGYSTLAGISILILIEREDSRGVFSRVDWPLLSNALLQKSFFDRNVAFAFELCQKCIKNFGLFLRQQSFFYVFFFFFKRIGIRYFSVFELNNIIPF